MFEALTCRLIKFNITFLSLTRHSLKTTQSCLNKLNYHDICMLVADLRKLEHVSTAFITDMFMA